jgi:thioesterase domain-containing protein/SAM-dependent methyltransferase
VPPDRPLFDSGRGLENYPMDGSRFRTGSVTISDIRTFEQSNYALSFVVVPDEALSLQLWYDAARFAPETADHLLRAAETLVLGLAADPDRTVGEVLDLIPAPARHPEPSVDTDQVARRLRALPLVREAVVRPAPDGRRLAAYLVPDPGADDGDGLAERHVAAWQSLYDQTYAAGGAATDPTRHFVGWNSSYTGEPIPAESMAEWRAHTIERIRALRPARVLEIGCGTGLLLTGLLDGCEHYLGTDFSAVCLAQVRAHLATRDPATRGAVTLRQQTADDPTGLDPGGFDVVILNSVVQYFPGQSYLERVLEVALRAAAPAGAVFLGDLRHHGLLAAFHTSVELHRAVDMLPADELHRRVSRSLAREQELLLDPAYLTGLPARRPEVGAVTVLPRRGRHDNELTRYRYDAVLRLGPPPPPLEAEWFDWHRDVLSRSEIGWLLEHAGGGAVGITGIPNARVAADVAAAQQLAGGDGPATAGELRLAAGKAPSGMDPEELYQLGEQRGWSVTVSWAVRHPDGSLNALFQRGTGVAHALAEAGEPDEPATAGPLTNPPLRSTLATELERQARAALADHPGDVSVLVLDELPRTADGRLDEAALPPPPDPLPEAGSTATGMVTARTADELRLARIWEQALGTGALDVRTSFFDLGGDSLLAIRVIDEAARALGRDVPLATLLQRPTIEGMAAALRAEPRPWTPLVEITGGDGPPFFCVHPAGGNVLCYGELARLLAPRPFCALQARGVEGDERPYEDLPAMAARYLADVRTRQPAGPYLLGGWSMGGLVAYEMAQQLAAEGVTVELLVLIETPVPELVDELPDEAAALTRLLDGVVPLDPDRLRAMPPADRLRYVLAEAERAQVVPPDQDRAQRLWDVYTTHLAAVRRYRPRPYAGRSLLLRAAETPIAAPDYGWRPLLTGPCEVVEVPGSHESVVWPPHVHRLAEVLRTRLA